MSETHRFLSYVPDGLDEATQQRAYDTYVGVGDLCATNERWDFVAHKEATDDSDPEHVGRRWALERLEFGVIGAKADVIYTEMTGRALDNLKFHLSNEGATVVGLIGAPAYLARSTRTLWVIDLRLERALAAIRGGPLDDFVLEHVLGTWGDRTWADAVAARGGIPHPPVHEHSAFIGGRYL